MLMMGMPNFNAHVNNEDLLIPRHILFQNPQKVNPKISPDGLSIAYLRPNDEDVLNICIKNIDDNEERIITFEKNRNIQQFCWQSDSKHILYINDNNGDENWKLFQTDCETLETVNLTPYEKVQARLLQTEINSPNEVVIELNLRDRSLHDIYLLNLETLELKLIFENPGNIKSFFADHNLHVRAYVTMEKDGSQSVFVREDEENDWKKLLNWGCEDISSLIPIPSSSTDMCIYCPTSISLNCSTLTSSIKISLSEIKILPELI